MNVNTVVIVFFSTSNHNHTKGKDCIPCVVIVFFSTSNHNLSIVFYSRLIVYIHFLLR